MGYMTKTMVPYSAAEALSALAMGFQGDPTGAQAVQSQMINKNAHDAFSQILAGKIQEENAKKAAKNGKPSAGGRILSAIGGPVGTAIATSMDGGSVGDAAAAGVERAASNVGSLAGMGGMGGGTTGNSATNPAGASTMSEFPKQLQAAPQGQFEKDMNRVGGY